MGKKIRNLLGTLLLMTAILVTQIPVTDVEAVETASTSDLSDSSSVSEFQMDGTTLVKYNGTAEDVSISDSVEKIEADAFAGNTSLKHVTIGGAVESIGASAFSGCVNLQTVSVPDSVLSIDTAAFSGCPSLREVSVGKGLNSLGNGVFSGDYSLRNVTFDSDNSYFVCEDGVIYNKKDKSILYQVLSGREGASFEMPSAVKQIKPYAFWGNYNLESVAVSSNAAEIPAYCFSNCRNLKEVKIPYSVRTIDMKAFEDCVRLRKIEIPQSVGSIHSTAFDGCTKLEIVAAPGTTAYAYAQTLVLDEINVSEYEEAPGVYTEEESSETDDLATLGPVDYYHEVTHISPLQEDKEDDSVVGSTRIIGQQAFILIDNASAKVNVGSTGETIGGAEVEEDIKNMDTVPGLEGSEDAKGGSFPKYTVVNEEIIAAQAYYDDPMESYSIPDGIVRIGDFSFARSDIKSIHIPEGVKEIGYAAFYHCDGLSDVVIPQSVETIEPSAFANTAWLSGWKQNVGNGSDFLIVGDGILLAYRGKDETVTIPGSVKQIGADAFREQTGITKVIIPEGVTVIGESAFADCSGLKEIEGAESVVEIRDRAFAGCPIETIPISDSVTKIGLRAFDRSGTEKEEGKGIVVFKGKNIPELSYETTATKLYREAFRDLAFKGVDVAVVPEGILDFTGTVLEAGKSGFDGTICYVTKEATEDEAGTLRVIQRIKNQTVDGKTYYIDGLAYIMESGSTGTVNTKNRSEKAAGEKGTVTVKINSNTLPADSHFDAVIEGSEEDYLLQITDSREAKKQIEDVYKELYGNKLPRNLCGYEMSLTEVRTDIPITSLGRQEITVTIPIPKGVGQENLHVVCLDQDGQLEEVTSRIVSADGVDCISFTAKHFSPYGIYNYTTSSGTVVADVKDGQAVFASLGKKDDSPNTGDYSIHPKWFMAAGLLFAALAMFFYRGGKRKWKENV